MMMRIMSNRGLHDALRNRMYGEGKGSGFSLERLAHFLNNLVGDVEIVVRQGRVRPGIRLGYRGNEITTVLWPSVGVTVWTVPSNHLTSMPSSTFPSAVPITCVALFWDQ